MGQIISISQAASLSSRLKKEGKSICLVGGCFDVLHPGHVIFLEKAKKAGDILVVLLESDEKIKKLKGVNRPVHTQKMRAIVLKALKFVDQIILLPDMKDDSDYEKLIKKIKPDIIAATEGSLDNHLKKRIAKLAGAKFIYVTKMIGNHSSSSIIFKNGFS